MQQMKSETFIHKWWTNLNAPLSLDLVKWIEQNYQGGDGFWKEIVFSMQEEVLPVSQSDYGKAYNFYHDCILRHIRSSNVALSMIGENGKSINWTYERLHHCVNYHVDKWSCYSPQAGQIMAIIGPPDIHFVISLLTALRLGLKIYYLPTENPYLGRGHLNKLLSEIKPHLIATEDSSISMGGIPLLSVNEKGEDEENYSPQSFAYTASTEVQVAISLYQQEALAFVPLDAQTLYLHALRDGLFTLNLVQHPYWSAPLSCALRTEPFCTIMTLLCGVARVCVPDDLIRKNPTILQDERINLLGVPRELQQLWIETPALPTRHLKCFYKNPLDTNQEGWKTFILANRAEKIPNFDLVIDNSCGGTMLFSRPTLEPFNIFLKPALGTPWSIKHINGSGEESLTGFGIFNLENDSDKDYGEGNFTATRIEGQMMLTGSIEPCREGVTFPIIELEQIVKELPFVENCMVRPIQSMGVPFGQYFVLLVFVNPIKPDIVEKDQILWSKEIEKAIIEYLGSGFLPDKIEFFPLMPKTTLLGIDRAWCANQHESGLLGQKKILSHYHVLGALKKLAQEVVSSEI